MIFFRLIVLVFFFLVAGRCYSQDLRKYELKSITEENGLPSNEVYHAIEDHEGFVWFATDNGLCRFNGSEFKIFDSRHGLPTKSVFHLFPQPDSSIVGVCSDARFFKIKDDKISLIFKDKEYQKHINPLHFPFAYYKDDKGNHHIGSRHGYFLFDSDTELITLDTATVEYRKINFWLNAEGDPFCFFKRNSKINLKLEIEYRNKQIGIIESDNSTCRSIYASSSDKFTFLHSESTLILVDNETKNVVSLNYNGYCLGGKIYGNELYVFTYRDGVLIYDISEGQFNYQYKLEPKLSVSSILKTKNGIIYLTTLENGIRIIDTHSPFLTYSSKNDNNITAITSANNNLVIGFESGEIHSLNKNKWFSTGRKIFDLEIRNGLTFISSYKHYVLYPKGNTLEEYEPNANGIIKSNWISLLNDSLVVLSGKNLFKAENILNHEIVFEESYFKEQFYHGEVIQEEVFLSYFSGIRIIKPLSGEKSRFIPTKSRVVDFYRHNRNSFALVDNMTILLLEGNTSHEFPIPLPESVTSVYSGAYLKNILHVSTNKGVFSWKLDRNGKPVQLINFDPIPLVRNLHLSNDTLLYATNKQVFKRPMSDLQVDIPTIFIKQVSIKDSVLTSNHIELPYASNTIEITIDNISLAEPFLYYRYRLEGNQNDYIYTNQGKITYSSLAPGKYTFIVSGTSDGFNYSEDKTFEIVIYPPFWKTWWFMTSVILLISVFAFLIIRIRIKQIRRKIELKETISKLRSQALIAQLNPHLVFNILNAIQGMVSKGKIEESNIYIARFSKFLRNSLNYSKKSTCSLEDEIRLINQYLNLERLRFGSKIDFSVETNIEDMAFMVPPLITQPLIENAIKHGVMPSKKKDKKISINYHQNGKTLLIVVTDNGRGFKDNYNSRDGLRITKERIKGLSELNEMTIASNSESTTVQLKIIKHD